MDAGCYGLLIKYIFSIICSFFYPDKEFDHSVNDTLMRFFDKCIKLVQEVNNNLTALEEINNFKKGPEMRRVQEKIAGSLNVSDTLITHGCI